MVGWLVRSLDGWMGMWDVDGWERCASEMMKMMVVVIFPSN